MKHITFVVGKTNTGYDAVYTENDLIAVITTGDDMAELKANILEAYNLYAEYHKRKPVTIAQVKLQYDLPSFFEYYQEINVAGLSKRIGLNRSLLSDYINGKRRPSSSQVDKILTGVKNLGKELAEIEFI